MELTNEIRNAWKGGVPVTLTDAQVTRMRAAVAGILNRRGKSFYPTGFYDSNKIRGRRTYDGP